VQAALATLPQGARILDAACGVGFDAASLHRRGFRVVGADRSDAMLGRAADRLAGTVALVRCDWAHPPFAAVFDAVLCTGNSLPHARTAAARRQALSGFAGILVAGGTLILDTHDWQAVHEAGSSREDDPLVVARHGVEGRRSYEWRVPARFEDPHVLVITLTLRGDGRERQSSHEIVLWPFTRQELLDELAATGFAGIEVVAEPTDDRYAVIANWP
jgi:SAM-dependent methyltransferase